MMRRALVAVSLILLCITISCRDEERPIPPPADLTQLALQFVNSMAAGAFGEAVVGFTSEMKEALPAKELADTWASITSANGRLRGLAGVRAAECGRFICVFVKCEFKLAKLDAKVVFDRNKSISGLWFVRPDPTKNYEPVAQTTPKPAEEQRVDTETTKELVHLAKGFVEQMSGKDYDAAVACFDERLRAALTAKELKKTWEKMLSAHGRFIGQIKTRTEKSGEFDIVYVTVQFKKSILDVKVVFNQDRRVSGLWFE
ncbi:MAG TPA: DUF3887 domain-containing protein [bacterium]|nr:DUF3887 domain-containing protein [bacterium]